MNKKLLTAAIGAALVAGPIGAHADAKVYGQIHASYDVLDADRTPSTEEDSTNVVASNSSRLGFRASEDLGGGLKGEMQFEFQVSDHETTAGSLSTNRNNYVGLSGGFGGIYLGTIDSAAKDVGGVADLFFRDQLGESRAIINFGRMDGRIENGIHYESPNFGGMTFKAQTGYSTENTIGAAAENEVSEMSLGVKGKHGSIAWGAGYYKQDRPGSGAGTETTTGIRAAVKVNFGMFDVTGFVQSVDDIGGTKGNDRDAQGVGFGAKFGNNYFKAQYYVADDLGSSSNTGANQISLGIDHSLSKTFKVYGTYAKTENDRGTSAFGVGDNGHGSSAATDVFGGEAKGFSVGIIQSF